jgi:hypothetical protein
MWALVQNNQIQVGPRDWNRIVFQDWLQENMNISMVLDLAEPNYSVIIDSQTQIMPVIVDGLPEYNPYTQELAGPFMTVRDGFVEGYFTTANRNLDTVRGDMLNDLSNNRYNREVSGVEVTIQDVTFTVPTDRVNRDLWTAMTVAQLDNVSYKVDNRTWLVLTKSDIQTVVAAILTKIQGDYAWEKSIHDAIIAAPDHETLAGIDVGNPQPASPLEVLPPTS